MKKEDFTIRCEVLNKFNLSRFDELKNIKREKEDVKGSLFVGDTFDCSLDLAKYLLGDNEQGKIVVKVIGISPMGK